MNFQPKQQGTSMGKNFQYCCRKVGKNTVENGIFGEEEGSRCRERQTKESKGKTKRTGSPPALMNYELSL